MDLKNRPIWLFPVIAAVLAGLAGALLIWLSGASGPSSTSSGAAPVRMSGEADIGGPFTLVDHTGRTVTEETFEGRPTLIYFGFTYCPDICPTSLQVMAAALDRLPAEQAAQYQPLLITVDPERDTPEALASYVDSPAFPENLLGLTGSEEQIRDAARAYRVYYRRVEDDGTLAEYTMDHSSLIYLMGRNGEFVEVFPHQATPDQIASRLQQFLENNPA
ncbi:SCO family protein [Oceanicaulis sp. MMSF_3324]|uniref:SCO family protein n=1 Tax=Oceanicaulis sp. MMSF_3324 TaxID=3046702 RepID=UPI00273E5C02|nr:SCO family protein [Oceanicaulis sp. MMSF_3324]